MQYFYYEKIKKILNNNIDTCINQKKCFLKNVRMF